MIYIVNSYILLVYVQLVVSIRSRLLKQCWPQYPGFTDVLLIIFAILNPKVSYILPGLGLLFLF